MDWIISLYKSYPFTMGCLTTAYLIVAAFNFLCEEINHNYPGTKIGSILASLFWVPCIIHNLISWAISELSNIRIGG